ncbi:uncharacterized protein H6S33_002482 [Morchella sextelata]|uniref:uncharacterized protein n=1 Tax=Morchella sextelata TaxID=1174677 RepID=UPI001D03B051|nr:uncharacterized protein H6S33_002482 [Morchella sextelata]KAH0607448.1 hypothetical protein H6S33_002482 [Morchella sextelata]
MVILKLYELSGKVESPTLKSRCNCLQDELIDSSSFRLELEKWEIHTHTHTQVYEKKEKKRGRLTTKINPNMYAVRTCGPRSRPHSPSNKLTTGS